MTYRIKRVSGGNDEISDTLHWLDKCVFGSTAPPVEPDVGIWWLVLFEGEPVGYAGLKWSNTVLDGLYLCRSGVLEEHRGHGLQVRLLRARETWARKFNVRCLLTDTTDNLASANSLIKAGYRLYAPERPWAFPNSLYWRKKL